jgi:hypothetical protein
VSYRQSIAETKLRWQIGTSLLQGTLDLLILKALTANWEKRPRSGLGSLLAIAKALEA